MALYTRSGDGGDTRCGDGQRVRKTDGSVAATGELDELNAHIGYCLQACIASGDDSIANALRPVMGELCAAAAVVAAYPGHATFDTSTIARIEGHIDEAAKHLPRLKHLLCPAGCELACRLHVARAVCRRTERRLVALTDAGGCTIPGVLAYVNRLSDLLFALARLANKHTGTDESTWTSPK